MKAIFTLLFVGIHILYSQESTLTKTYESFHIAKANDSQGMLDAGMVYTIRLNSSPKGSGTQNEVSGGYHLFPEENNIAWLSFTALKASRITIRIVPDSTQDDYDFLLFKEEGASSLKRISNKSQKPLRSNCARTQNIEDGVTGLAYPKTLPDHVGQGTGSSFSQAIDVVRGEKYFLVLNNVYDEGSGVSIYIDYWQSKTITGTVKDEQQHPIETDVTWEDRATGDTLAQTRSDAQTGDFTLEVLYTTTAESGYVLVASSDTLVFSEKEFTAGQIMACSPEPIHMVLKELKKGTSMTFGSINFAPNKDTFLKSANPSLRRLHRLMKANPYMRIRIEGHTHGSNFTTQKLSEDRANAVRDYLVEHGITQNRMTTIGHSGKYMLYPLNTKKEFASKNRRVEIMVTNY